MHRRDRRVKRGRQRKKEEALFSLLRPVAVRGVTVVAAVMGYATGPLSSENSAVSPGFTAGKGVLPSDFDFPLIFGNIVVVDFHQELRIGGKGKLKGGKGAIFLENSENTYKIKSELQYDVKSYCMEYYFETKTVYV
ncbi:hypothetical protein Ahy_A07g037187 isoform C [Arachis hypogaea]|uniref:Uncharacterized protein n=1 Tax=Arachis hypogaea TaxID=3818 RepID=A0A445CI16_ARAHY|nr:hypothetical protein Ahy_A07g037187 isoform C [Arachis hypogaea]